MKLVDGLVKKLEFSTISRVLLVAGNTCGQFVTVMNFSNCLMADSIHLKAVLDWKYDRLVRTGYSNDEIGLKLSQHPDRSSHGGDDHAQLVQAVK